MISVLVGLDRLEEGSQAARSKVHAVPWEVQS